MKPSPYQMALGYFCLLCVCLVIIVVSVSLFILHSEQLATSGTFLILFALVLGLIVTGVLQIRAAYKQGQKKHWYQQYEIPLGVSFFCFFLIFPAISFFGAFFHAHPLRIVYYLEMAVLLFCAVIGIVFMGLSFKYRPDWMKEKS